ncbi:BnaC05g40330D [Brassica napus]|uniref:DUF659 domain-containing protein n=2 Tax=Brassica TaxID=3705 RepID=A0A0D3CKQ8_BRAOL|nr:PREDICTED: uncharacterized protein LOC106293737 [Brassica oleracea var. oleracea]CAF1935065.1 unnamed protein product [Brassica napus]CDY23561.1 BnaC05g40330D [Brassica napus]
MDIHDHGVWVNENERRVRCKHCGKEMTGLNRLKRHLSGTSSRMTPCTQVTLTIREAFRDEVTKEESDLTAAKSKRVGEVQMGNDHKRGREEEEEEEDSSRKNESAENEFLLSNKAQKCIGEMKLKIPDSEELNGCMLQEAVEEVQDHVNKIKDSWAITGCSILLDAWVDQKGHDLVTFVADSPAGPVYLNSFYVSDIKKDVAALTSLVYGVVEDVGVHNVVQIIACSTSGWVGELGQSFKSNNLNVFWSVSVSHCFELMLVEIVKMESFKYILEKVSNITEFINNNREDSQGMTVSSSEFEFVKPYLAAGTILKAKNNLEAMVASPDWNKEEGTTVSTLVKDSSFWECVERLVKSTSPLIRSLHLFSTVYNSQHAGYVYDTMDGIKESIAKELNNEELCYKPLWRVIDDVWNNHLHSPLHVAGYFLNPAAFYSTDFQNDTEVTTDFISALGYLVQECQVIAKIGRQLKMYRLGKGCFNEASQADKITGVIPGEWWAQKASEHPELQSFAVKVLSQTCEGASRYKLKRNVAEKLLLSKGVSPCEKQHLEELAFVHYNLHLQSSKLQSQTK